MVFVTDKKQVRAEGWLLVKLLYNPQETQQKWQTQLLWAPMVWETASSTPLLRYSTTVNWTASKSFVGETY